MRSQLRNEKYRKPGPGKGANTKREIFRWTKTEADRQMDRQTDTDGLRHRQTQRLLAL